MARAFLSTAPLLFRATIGGFQATRLAGERTRLALERPLESDLISCRAIDDAVPAIFPEARTFRLDHYPGK